MIITSDSFEDYLAAVWDIQIFCDLAFCNENTEFGKPPASEPPHLAACPHSLH